MVLVVSLGDEIDYNSRDSDRNPNSSRGKDNVRKARADKDEKLSVLRLLGVVITALDRSDLDQTNLF